MRALMIAAALAFTAAAPAVHAQTARKDGPPPAQCQGPDGKDATNAKCKGAGAAPPVYKLDAKGVCRDSDGKAVKKANCAPTS